MQKDRQIAVWTADRSTDGQDDGWMDRQTDAEDFCVSEILTSHAPVMSCYYGNNNILEGARSYKSVV